MAYAGLSPGEAGLIWFAKEISMMVFQVPMGALVDHTTHKKAWLILFTLICTLVPMTIVLTRSVPLLLVKSVVEGFAATCLRVFKGPFTLGIAGHENFEDIAKHTELFEHTGSLVSCAIAGVIGYVLYPNVLPVFYVIGAFGSLGAVALALMREEKEDPGSPNKNKRRCFLDDDVARNSRHATAVITAALTKPVEESRTPEQPEEIRSEEGAAETEATAAVYTESLKTIFFKRKTMSFWALTVFFFHLGNAAVLPVLGQVLALDDAKAGIPYTASNVVVAQLSSFLGVYIMEWFVEKGFKINIPIIIGFGALIPRVVIILIILNYSRNPYALIATQVLDGIGAGTNGLSMMRVTKTLTEGTNRFGVVFSIVRVTEAVGSALSNLISGYIIGAHGYQAGFIFMMLPGFLSVLFMHLTKVEIPKINIEKADETSLSSVEEGTKTVESPTPGTKTKEETSGSDSSSEGTPDRCKLLLG